MSPEAVAIDEVCGAALILDDALRVVLVTPAAQTLLGFDVPVGDSAPKLLCGKAPHRPLADALAAGRAIQVVLQRPTKDDPSHQVRVRALPLVRDAARVGWILFLEQASGAVADGEVEFHGMWTRDPAMKRVFHVIERVASADAPVLVRGETGAGKELVANAIHELSSRRKGPFRAINCAAVPANLLESELFGYHRGAFTGAVKDTPGHVQLAHGGTLFLDEVAELSLELQAKLLRVIETHSVLPLGARHPVPVDIRVVSATHRSLRKAVEEARFRADLMYRLRVIPIYLPPLRARRRDVMLLAMKFIEQNNARGRRRIERIAPSTESILTSYDWPGNVRELLNVLEYAYVIGDGPVLAPSDLPPELGDQTISLAEHGAVIDTPRIEDPRPEARLILAALERSAGSRDRAAQILGISRITLWRRMKELGLPRRKRQPTNP